MIFAADGCDFVGRNRGGHGSIGRKDVHVPMIIAGTGIAAGSRLPRARIVDLTPTLLDLMDVPASPSAFDGRSRARELLSTGRPTAERAMR
jgi:arylsulfatase A-like enzyme